VKPAKGKETSKIAFLAPTLSYLAYGNNHAMSKPTTQFNFDLRHFKYPSINIDKYLIRTNLLSLYDTHTDGSGVCHASRLRPVLSMRPQYRDVLQGNGRGAPHQFPADLWTTNWMEAKGFEFDVITDEDLHWEGLTVLSPYRVVVTGTHPEYWSGQMLDALGRYLRQGGRLMYLGGNGFYWVTGINSGKPHVFEVRRWGGTQTWRAKPGEFHLSSTGELGGLWANRGRAPQRRLGWVSPRRESTRTCHSDGCQTASTQEPRSSSRGWGRRSSSATSILSTRNTGLRETSSTGSTTHWGPLPIA
jgi:N,N-dimethylformamidase